MATTVVVAGSSDPFAMLSRPQIGIDRLPVRRPSNNDPKEAMNCKSCRKRKIKCNRLRPSCEACQVFNCSCVYDAVPKKRGPKTDVLEALLKRVNGLEKRLKDEKKSDSPDDAEATGSDQAIEDAETSTLEEPAAPAAQSTAMEDLLHSADQHQVQFVPPSLPIIQPSKPAVAADTLLDTYFARLHGKPYYILDEPATRQRLHDGQLPPFLLHAIYACSVRYAPQLCGGLGAAVRNSEKYSFQSRADIDVDEPSIEHLQALLLLTMAAYQSGRGKRSYMFLSHAISMALALGLHRELSAEVGFAPSEREGRRRLFWTCYLMDRFTVSGSKRPPLISDDAIYLRLPAWLPAGSIDVGQSQHLWATGNYFPNGSSLSYAAGSSVAGQGSGSMLVEIVRVLGITNRYLAAGGVKGDSHFPWHAQSTFSRIRTDLDFWIANTQDTFSSLDALFGQPDSTTLVLSKLVYHLIHCLIYRPFLPIDLAELSGSGQHQSWQIEATNLCFLHANAIAELVEVGKSSSIVDWPSFVGYCICTSGTIHVHGAHYIPLRDGDVFSNSSELLAREMSQLYEFPVIWAGVQHQRETLQTIYSSHQQLVKSLATSPARLSPVFQMEGFFDRYPGSYIDGAHVSFSDVNLSVLVHEHQSTVTSVRTTSHENWSSQLAQEPNLAGQSNSNLQFITANPVVPANPRAKRKRTMNPYLTQTASGSEPRVDNGLERRTSYEGYMAAPQLPPPQQQQQQQQQQQPYQHATSEAEMPSQLQTHDQYQAKPFISGDFSPSLDFSPMEQTLGGFQEATDDNGDAGQWYQEAFWGTQSFDYLTPGNASQCADSARTDSVDKDPLSKLTATVSA